ncbi:MAG TPA: amidohydrolase family protein, partial [Gammaproteobacteria bacterium]
RQGTNLSVALAPHGQTLVVDLLGQLWSLPVTGGGAVPLTPAGSEARNPRFSPDGGRVVYQKWNDGQWDLSLLDVATGMEQPLTATPYDEREPDFTPDGRSVVFAANRDGHFALWSLAIDGGAPIALTDTRGDSAFPTVSDQGHVAYVHLQDGEWSIRVRDPSGAVTAVHTSRERLSAPTWRPGGGVLVFGERDSTRSSRLQMLLLAEPRVMKPLSGSEDLFVARAAWVSAAEFIYGADGQLWRREVATPVRRPIHLFAASTVEVATTPTDLPRLDAPGERIARGINGLVRSPNGRSTAFTALGDVWLAERGPPQRLTDDVFVDLDPEFWPDGESIVFSSERTGQFELWRISLQDDHRLTQLTFGALQPRHPTVSGDGRRIAYLERTTLEPWAPTILKVRDTSNGGETIVARDLIAPAPPEWSEDGLVLRVRARSATLVNGAARPFTAELRTTDNAESDVGEPQTLAWTVPAPPADYVVQIGRLFDGVQGTYRRHVDLHVRAGRIAAIVGRGVLPAVGEIVDARDATVIPGLIDLHAHSSSLTGERLGRAWLAYGVTTVREIAPNPLEALERAELWASERAPGPRLWITPASGSASMGEETPIRTYPGIAAGFAHGLQSQATVIGIAGFGSPSLPARLTDMVARSTPELPLSPGLSAYQDGIGRLTAADMTFVPGLAALAGLAHRPALRRDSAYGALFTPVEQAAWSRPDDAGAAVPVLAETVARLVRAGGRVAVGSDAPAVPQGLGLHLELALLAEAGLPNDQILRMATIQGALALGLERDLGTLDEGKLADFVVLEGDPLAEIDETLTIVAVVKGGVWR